MRQLLAIPVYLIKILLENGLIYLLCFVASYIYLTIYRIIWKKRLDVYDLTAPEPDKVGFVIPQIEREIERPQKSRSLKKFCDDVFIFGTNSESEQLAVYIARLPQNYVRCSLLVRLANGRLYTLPKEHTVQKATMDENTFGSARLKVECMIPLRKWRVFFNGILEECTGEDDSQNKQYVHARFTFLWVTSSEVFDFYTDMSKIALSHSAASAASWTSVPSFLLQKLHSVFDRHEEPGMLLGTLQIQNDPEKEVYLWGSKTRSMGRISNFQNSTYTDILGNFSDGSLIHICFFSIPGVIKRFICGFVMRPDGFVFPIDKLEAENVGPSFQDLQLKCWAGGQKYRLSVKSIESKGIQFLKEFDGPSSVKTANCKMNDVDGKGMIFRGIVASSERSYVKRNSIQSYTTQKFEEDAPYFIPLSNVQCESIKLCGGKGSSLGKLFRMSEIEDVKYGQNKFLVPKGFVVTTAAYDAIVNKALEKELTQFEKDVWSNADETAKLCERIETIVKDVKLPDAVKNAIDVHLKKIFGETHSDLKFAVRSSATGEDTDQMSAAGQMETFLGVKGVEEIAVAIMKCWSSQFTLQAVEYKRRYGQRLNMPMAVVVQEMVSSDIAGVIFTCDPISGNPLHITMTANWGLGESVVSASAEPDTVILEKDMQNQLKIHSITIGKKKLKTVVADDTGTKDVEVNDDESSVCCLTDEQACKLGQIAIEIENEYGSPQDIEWGICNGTIFLFQSRPVTSIDIDTAFEIEHFADSAMRAEDEMISRAHVGEAMPGAISKVGGEMMNFIMNAANAKKMMTYDGDLLPNKPYLPKGIVIAYYTLFFSLISGMFNFGDNESEFTKALTVAFFGRLIDTTEIKKRASQRHGVKKFSIREFIMPFHIIYMSFFSHMKAKRARKNLQLSRIPYKGSKTSFETLHIIASHYPNIYKGFHVHMDNSFSSTFWNSLLLKLLAKAEGDWDNKVYSDFAYLLSTCPEVESANVPSSIQELAYIISKNTNLSTFKKMPVDEALEYLKNDKGVVGSSYKKFLKRHGHRCIKEFDVYSEVWETNPRPLIKTLQSMVNENAKAVVQKQIDSFSTILSKLKFDLNFLERLKLRFILPFARNAVGDREQSKAFVIKQMNEIRKAFNHMGDQLVREGRLPRREHMFFLSVHEIYELSKNRLPRLVLRAGRRQRCFEKVDKLMFQEIITGIPRPINLEEDVGRRKGFLMTGVPVSRGVATAQASVIKSINEASNIRQGNILITYSTDIAWSPYFPLLSGIVTELGGLISHGAVVAREYGLPCVVALHGATRYFNSGDLVVLDGNEGTLRKID